jgi:hypothetical protein
LFFADEIITPDIIKSYLASKRAREAVTWIGQVMDSPSQVVSARGFVRVRNYLIIQILIGNANRAGGIINLTHKIFAEAVQWGTASP